MSAWNTHAPLAATITLEDIENASRQTSLGDGTPILKLLSEAHDNGYDLVCVPLTTEKWKNRWQSMCLATDGESKERSVDAERVAEAWRSNPVFERDEVTMTRLEEAENVTVMISDWLELDSPDDWVRHDSELALQQELAYAAYLNVVTVVLPPPRHRDQVASYARIVNGCLNKIAYMQLSVRIPIYDPSIFRPSAARPAAVLAMQTPPPGRHSHRSSLSLSLSLSSPALPGPGNRSSISSTDTSRSDAPSMARRESLVAPEDDLNSTWEMWDLIRCICGYNPRLTLTLDLTPPLPSVPGVMTRWEAEPTRHVLVPASTFIANAKGYPVLPKSTQGFLRDFFKHRPTVIFSGTNRNHHPRGGETAYVQYIRYIEKSSPAVKALETSGTVENFAQGYQDYLQAPLQPLMDNLQSMTYQTFEQDPVKYQKYEDAVFLALSEWPGTDRLVVCVAGAGRGPLVARCLAASERAKRSITLYAVEKNPNAILTLQERLRIEWHDRVTLLFGDMRAIDLPEKVDILVSELLGSFGDNELSPECLDGAMRFLKPNGISIPSSYTSYLAPLSSSKLFNEACVSKDVKSCETPYVVMFQAVNILSGDGSGLGGRCGPQIQDCWEFEHPRRDVVLDARGLPMTNSHNTRSATLTFHIPHAGTLHGLAGYFEAVLYQNVGLSIHPHRQQWISKDMLSWFPLFFPFKEPLYLPSNSELKVSIWRLTNTRQVWYEWYAESFLPVSNVVASQETVSRRKDSLTPSINGSGSFLAVPSTPVAMPSPLVDAIDPPWGSSDTPWSGASTPRAEMPPRLGSGSVSGVVKIGQTSLQNPGGRSSWIGL